MIRQPTNLFEAFKWWRDAVDGRMDQSQLHAGDPRPGFFKTRIARQGAWVPAAIFITQSIDPDTGELDQPEEFVCIVNGEPKDLWSTEVWIWLSTHPIPEKEFRFMTARAEWAEIYAPDSPYAKPYEQIDMLSLPPIF